MSVIWSVPFCKDPSEQPPDECYLTQPIAVAAMLIALRRRGWEPPRGPIIDPCACGWGNWSVGAMVAEFWGRDAILSDLSPRGEGVASANAEERDYTGAGMVVTNPHFKGADILRRRALAQGVPVMLLQSIMWFCDGGRFRGLVGRVRHEKRLAFSILPEHVERLRNSGTKVRDNAEDSVTGFGLGTDGRHHAWGLYEPGSESIDDWGTTGMWSPEAHALAAPWLKRARESEDFACEVAARRPQLALF